MAIRLSQLLTGTTMAALLAGSMMFVPGLVSADSVAEGKELAFDRKKGNCLACHMIEGGESPGDIGPPLVAMKARFPDRAALKAQIEDATVKNPESIMPAFGKYKALSDAEIEKIIDFMYTL